MKLIPSLFIFISIQCCIAQTNIATENFISGTREKYVRQELNSETQYFRMLIPLAKAASATKTVELKAKKTHSNRNSRFLDRNQMVGFYAFEYANKKACKQSVDSLLKCFPNFCVTIENGTPAEGQFTPSVYIINNKEIYCIETYCEDVNEQWEEMKKKFIDTFATNASILIVTSCGKLEWTSKEKLVH